MINEIIGENNGRTIEWVDRVEVDFPIYEK